MLRWCWLTQGAIALTARILAAAILSNRRPLLNPRTANKYQGKGYEHFLHGWFFSLTAIAGKTSTHR